MNKVIFLVLLAMIMGLTGCASIEKLDDNLVMSETEKVEYSGKSIDELLVTIDQLLAQARSDELTVYSPRHYSQASKEAKGAAKVAKKTDDPATKDKVVTSIVKIKRYLERAAGIKATVLIELKDVFDNKAYLIAENIAKDYPGDYEDVLDDIADIIKDYELGNLADAIGARAKLLESMKELEGTVMVERHLQEARNTMEKVDDEDLDEYAPKSYELAESTLKRSEDIIMRNPRDKVLIASAGQEALTVSKHAYHVGMAVVSLQKIKPEDMELIVLDEEERLLRIAKALNAKDVRDLDLNNQSRALAALAEQLFNDRRTVSIEPEVDANINEEVSVEVPDEVVDDATDNVDAAESL